MRIRIRRAVASDVATLADLTTQLAYPVEADELGARLRSLLAEPQSAVLVAADEDDRAVGRLHVELHASPTNPRSVHIAGLVVDEGHRSQGIGHGLLVAGEAWAREQGVARMTLY